jgi:peptidoglycan/xylan/chitin deacetylase (PgdA/CDA1 family)/glycosyltransferase involved in cell wall biosynthesis
MRNVTRLVVKGTVGGALFRFGLHRRLLGDKATIVAFHTIGDRGQDNSIQVSQEMFIRYCRYFKKYFEVVSLRDLVDDMRNNRQVGGKLAITFDDGYKDNYTFAALELERAGLPATFFITTNFIDSQAVPWWDEKSDVAPEWMTWDEIIDLDRRGFEIGAHTISHANLGSRSEEDARSEIVGSKRIIEEKLGHKISNFAFPYGGKEHITETAKEIAKQAGFESCVSCFGGLVTVENEQMELPRVPINDWYVSPSEFGLDVVRSQSEAPGEYPQIKEGKKNILMVSYHLYPDASVGAKRPSELLKFMAENDHAVTGMGGTVRKRALRDDELGRRLDGFRILRAPQPPSMLDWLWKNMKAAYGSRRSVDADAESSAGPKRNNVGHIETPSIRDRLRHHYYAMHSLYGAHKFWAFFSMMRLIVDRFGNRYDIVISSGPPSAAHIVGRFAAALHNCRYVMDFRDPWVGNPGITDLNNTKLRDWLEKAAERNCFDRACSVAVTSPGIQRMLSDRYPGQSQKLHVVYNGYDGDPKPPPEPSGRLDMLYAGELYLNRDPFPLLEAIKALVQMADVDRERVSMTFVGSCDAWNGISLREWIEGNECEDVIDIRARVSAREMEALTDKFTVLVNLAQGQPDQIPAKTFDYLASGKKMLLVTEPGSSTFELVESVDNVIVLESDQSTTESCQRLRDLYDEMTAGSASPRSAQIPISSFSRMHQNRSFLKKINVKTR